MYAIVETGGRQYRAEVGGVIQTERLPFAEGESVTLDRVLLIADDEGTAIGVPVVPGAQVRATVLQQFKGKKIRILKYKPKQRYRVRQGHRQHYTRLRIDEIVAGGTEGEDD